MHRHQRRRTRRVHRHRGTPQPQQIRDAAHRDAVRVAGAGVGADHLGRLGGKALVFVVVDAHHDAGSAAAQRIRRDTGVLERLPGDLEQHPLLRIHRLGFARGDAEEIGVETGHIGDEAAPLRRHPTRRKRIGIVERVGIPPIRRHLADRVSPSTSSRQKLSGPTHITGKPTPDPHHRHRLRNGDAGSLVELVGQGSALLVAHAGYPAESGFHQILLSVPAGSRFDTVEQCVQHAVAGPGQHVHGVGDRYFLQVQAFW